MKGGGFVDGIYTLLFIVAVIGAMVLGGYLALKYVKRSEDKPNIPAPAPAPAPKPRPEPDYPGWGPGPWGPDPWTPNYNPDVPSEPPKPAPPDNFKPVLNLLNAKYDPVNRYIHVDYKILPSGSVPPSKTFTINYDILEKGIRIDDFSEEEPLTASEMTGLQQASLVPVTGADRKVKASDLTLSAQIHYRENGTVNMGVIGLPATINVK
jgi:hypothetical protein